MIEQLCLWAGHQKDSLKTRPGEIFFKEMWEGQAEAGDSLSGSFRHDGVLVLLVICAHSCDGR